MNKESINLMQLKLKNPQMTQRDLSVHVGMSLGKVNCLLNQLKQSEVVDAHFSLTSKGQNYISDHHPQRAVILAAGYGMRMVPINTEEPKGLLEINNEPLIERLIKQLHAKNINDIQIVVGFMKEHYEYLIDKYDVQLIVNSHYSEWNNIYSLYLARKQLENSYIIPCDVWFKENPFSSLEDQSWYMFSNHTNNNSEWQVSSRGTVKQVKENGNQMVGLAYINSQSGQMLRKALDERIDHQEQLNQFWESTLDNHGKFILNAYLINDSQYAEVNSYEELRDLDSNSGHLKNDAITVIKDTLKIDVKEIKNIHTLKKGMTNRSFIFTCRDKRYIMRIPGAGTKQLINRQHEFDVYQTIKDLPYVEHALYLNPQNGYKLTQFIENSRNCNPNDWNDVQKSMQLLREMHNSHLKVSHSFDLRQQIEMYEHLRNASSAYRDYEEVKARVEQLLSMVEQMNKDWTLCHIDANADNFVFDSDGKIFLIDWEYAGMQDPHIDIAMFAIYSMYNQKQIDRLISLYFEGKVNPEIKKRIYAYIAICGLLWSNWCEYKQSLGLDFGEYSLAQYRYAKEYSRKVLGK